MLISQACQILHFMQLDPITLSKIVNKYLIRTIRDPNNHRLPLQSLTIAVIKRWKGDKTEKIKQCNTTKQNLLKIILLPGNNLILRSSMYQARRTLSIIRIMLQKIQTLIQVIRVIAVEVQAYLALTHNPGMTEMQVQMMIVVQMAVCLGRVRATHLMKKMTIQVAPVVVVVRLENLRLLLLQEL